MKRFACVASVLAVLALAAGADNPETQTVKQLMNKLHKGANAPLTRLKTALKSETPDWKKVQDASKELVVLGAGLPKTEPAKGDKANYEKLATSLFRRRQGPRRRRQERGQGPGPGRPRQARRLVQDVPLGPQGQVSPAGWPSTRRRRADRRSAVGRRFFSSVLALGRLPPHAKSCLTTLPPSTILIGRPRGLMFSLVGSILRAWQTLRSRSLTATGWSLTSVPSALEAPMTWPPLTPPPARATLKTRGKWSRPAFGLIFGRPAELAHPDDQRPVEHPAGLQVGDQRGEAGVDVAGELADPLVDRPGGCPSRWSGPRRTSRPPGPAGGRAGSPGRTGSGRRPSGPRRLVVEVERLHPGREDHAGRLAVERRVVLHPVGAAGHLEARVLQRVEQARAGARTGAGRLRRQDDVGRGLLRVGDHERLERRRRASPRRSVGPPMLTMCGRSNFGSPSSLATTQPKLGCLTVPVGEYPVWSW